jgi:hypothetical protein
MPPLYLIIFLMAVMESWALILLNGDIRILKYTVRPILNSVRYYPWIYRWRAIRQLCCANKHRSIIFSVNWCAQNKAFLEAVLCWAWWSKKIRVIQTVLDGVQASGLSLERWMFLKILQKFLRLVNEPLMEISNHGFLQHAVILI